MVTSLTPLRARQMETKEALECVEDICAVPGLDSIVYGGMDWSGSLGFPHLPTWDLIEKEPEMLAAYDRVCAACKASGANQPPRPHAAALLAAWLTCAGSRRAHGRLDGLPDHGRRGHEARRQQGLGVRTLAPSTRPPCP